jgi:nucleotide-binding universal stress UspA family protein
MTFHHDMRNSARPQATATTGRLVAAIDFTSAGDEALEDAVRMARAWRGGELHFVHVAPRNWGPMTAETIERGEHEVDDLRVRLRSYVHDRLSRMAPVAGFEVYLHLRFGETCRSVADLCADVDADLVIVGRQGRTGFSKLFHRSVAAGLVEAAHCPVLVAKAKRYAAVETQRPERSSIQPACSACMRERNASGGQRMWCARHEHHAPRQHVYGYTEEWGFGGHDANILGA